MKEFNDNQFYQYPPFNPVAPSPHWDMTHDKVIPVVSSVGNGPKGDPGDALVFDDLTDKQLEKIYEAASFVGNESIDGWFETTANETTIIDIPILDFDEFDLLFVDIEGLTISENIDYSIIDNKIILETPITKPGTRVHFRAIRYSTIDGDKNIIKNTKRNDYRNVDEMKADGDLVIGDICHTLGFNSPGDKGAAWYYIVATGTSTGTDAIKVKPGIAMLAIENNKPNPEMFGAFNYTILPWEGSGRTYSTRTVVEHDNKNYIARKKAPIGTDILNTEYWIECAV